MKHAAASFAVCLVVAAAAAHAEGTCRLSLKPYTSGFFLNPTLQKLVVIDAEPVTDGKPCPLASGDELLEINERVVSGAKAREIMSYWEALPNDRQRIFKVRRDGTVLTIPIG